MKQKFCGFLIVGATLLQQPPNQKIKLIKPFLRDSKNWVNEER
jgi:hypothetical protein